MPDTALGPGHGHVIVCGTEHLGLRTIDELRRREEAVVAIAPDGDAADSLAAKSARAASVARRNFPQKSSSQARLPLTWVVLVSYARKNVV